VFFSPPLSEGTPGRLKVACAWPAMHAVCWGSAKRMKSREPIKVKILVKS
jgi:hypothetical protein